MSEQLNGYVCFHKGKRYEIYAKTSYDTQQLCAKINKIKKPSEITVMLAEKNGKTVEHTATF